MLGNSQCECVLGNCKTVQFHTSFYSCHHPMHSLLYLRWKTINKERSITAKCQLLKWKRLAFNICGGKVTEFSTGSRLTTSVDCMRKSFSGLLYNKEVASCSKYLDDKMAKSPPSISRILQKITPLTKGTVVSS